MGIFRRRAEVRADAGEVQFEDTLLKALLGSGPVTRETALQVPTISGGIDLIANLVASTPVKLYRDKDGKAEEVRDDPRIALLNDETGDTLNANEFWRAITRDYYLGKGGYAYINKEKGRIKSLHYVDEAQIAIQKNNDPIFKDYTLLVNGREYLPFEFLKILRNTRDGAQGVPITEENSKLIETAYQTLCFEGYLVKKGGNKKGFLKSEKSLTDEALKSLREAYARLYSNNGDNMMVLNKGIEFQETSNTSAEMQLNENKLTNAQEFAKVFHISTDVMAGKGTENDISSLARLAAIPLMTAIQCALNKDFLLEAEKGRLYWAFDTKELLKGDMKERFEAYRTALDANFMSVDEVRYQEDMEPFGLNWIKLGLQDVLYDPKTKMIYTPNTNQTSVMGETKPKAPLPAETDDAILESRANPYHDPKNGRFTSKGGGRSGGGKAGKTKYAPSPQRNKSGVQMTPKSYAKLCGEFKTRYPEMKPEDGPRWVTKGAYRYNASADGHGGLIIHDRAKIK